MSQPVTTVKQPVLQRQLLQHNLFSQLSRLYQLSQHSRSSSACTANSACSATRATSSAADSASTTASQPAYSSCTTTYPAISQPAQQTVPELPAAPQVVDDGGFQGWLQQQDVVGVNSNVVLRDANGEFAAVVIIPSTLTVKPGEFQWRRVIVQGSSVRQEVEIEGIKREVSVVTASDLYLAK